MPSNTSLVLASGSTYKRQLLERLDFDFTQHAPDIDESSRLDESPRETARRLAAEKARRVRTERRDAPDRGSTNEWIIAADQVIVVDGDRLTKPGSIDAAIEQLLRLSDRTHLLSTAVALAPPDGNPAIEQVDFEMEMRDLDRQSIEHYVANDEPTDCAGAYKIERSGIRLFKSMRGDDYTAIIGLPLTRVWTLLEANDYFNQ